MKTHPFALRGVFPASSEPQRVQGRLSASPAATALCSRGAPRSPRRALRDARGPRKTGTAANRRSPGARVRPQRTYSGATPPLPFLSSQPRPTATAAHSNAPEGAGQRLSLPGSTPMESGPMAARPCGQPSQSETTGWSGWGEGRCGDGSCLRGAESSGT